MDNLYEELQNLVDHLEALGESEELAGAQKAFKIYKNFVVQEHSISVICPECDACWSEPIN